MRHRSWTFTRPRKALAVLVAAAALAAVPARFVPVDGGLGIQPTGIIGAGGPPVAAGKAATLTIYLVKGGRLVPVVRPGLPGQPYLSITQLSVPVTSLERRNGLRSAVPAGRQVVVRAGDRQGEINVDVTVPSGRTLSGAKPDAAGVGWPRIALGQLACTAQTVPGVRRVMIVAMWDNQVVQPWMSLTCGDFGDLLG
ncbi:hypothetical protein [Actinomadura decatromicini]|uniref:GerMN domain-containing protein n=1 Tax=Actinomadura decatromicini TaxID=2604572 RepID=A0A5D3FJ51_9ACTN|nr:hypothetical protein [Actinomadura decatromicini]TYK48058.1 hypothetical protein FXF68_20475 [Actinomadura decatromicini]